MAISEQDKQAIDQAVAQSYFVETDEQGNKFIRPYYTDYQDTNEFLLQAAYDARNNAFQKGETPMLTILKEKIAEAYEQQRWDIEDEIIRKAGFDPSDDKAQEQIAYLRDAYYFEPSYDHFLNDDVLVNVIISTDFERNRDHATIHEQYEALTGRLSPKDTAESLAEESGLSFLVEQQGHSMEQLHKLMAQRESLTVEDIASNDFLVSVCDELINLRNSMNGLTVLVKMDLYDYATMMEPNTEITFSKDSFIGFFSPWSGGGSDMNISLEKDLVVPSELIFEAQIEGAEPDQGYTLNSVYGCLKRAWKPFKGIREVIPEKKASLDQQIQDAQGKVQSAEKNSFGKEPERG